VPSEIVTVPVQKRRGMKSRPHGRQAIGRILAYSRMRKSDCQYFASFSAKYEEIFSSTARS
jgi:hypothetical protein